VPQFEGRSGSQPVNQWMDLKREQAEDEEILKLLQAVLALKLMTIAIFQSVIHSVMFVF